METYEGVIFDFNGTMFFDDDKHVKAWGKISRLLRGKDITDEELHERLNGTPNIVNIQYMMDGKANEQELTKYSQMKEEYYRKFCREDEENFHLAAGTERYLDYLKEQGIPMTIASASIRENMDFFIESFQLERWFQPSLIVYDDGTYENKVAMFKKAAELIGIDMGHIRIYEDSLSGIKSAYEAGCTDIAVICAKEKEPELRKMPGVTKTMQDFLF
ncbi:HAD family hydrolase [Anaerostipes sp.]|uniref:HAD family hydrolase n=1 Tax=Anaerostipes sp. TaxID=1872530 RepID=UPI0025C11D0F|nr:HAD hydrolase-like protein [Anaerostipes sp.]MBS7009429.1 HAD hydrolase-like protein [Anaerostipes sp.]